MRPRAGSPPIRGAAWLLGVLALSACDGGGARGLGSKADEGAAVAGTPARTAELLARAERRFSEGATDPFEPEDPRVEAAGRLLLRGRFAEARAALEPLLGSSPAPARARLFFALSLHKQKRYAEAEPHFEQVLAAGPAFRGAEAVFGYYGWCLYWQGRPAEAEVAFAAWLRFQPGERDAWFGLGVCDLEAGRLEAARERLERSAGLARAADAPRDVARAQARLADVALALGDTATALAALEEAVAIPEAPYETWHKLAGLRAACGDLTGAAAAREEFERRRPPEHR